MAIAIALVALAPSASEASPPGNRLVSHAASGNFTGSNASIQEYTMSANGRYIAYRADPSGVSPLNLTAGFVDHTSGSSNVFLYDTTTGGNALVSHSATLSAESANDFSQRPTIS